MILNLLLAVVFFISMQVHGSVREFDDVTWQAGINEFLVELSLDYSESVSVSFEQQPGRALSLNVDAPYLVRNARLVDLFLLTSPIRTVEQRQLVATIKRQPELMSGKTGRLTFNENIESLVESMAQGDWVVLRVESSDGVSREIELPAIDFGFPFQAFNKYRNTLPPIGWDDASHMVVNFSLGGAGLSAADKRRLDDLMAYIQADNRVVSLTIDAHADTSGHRLSNLTLSSHRADAVKEYLLNTGLAPEMLDAVRHHGQRFPMSGASAAENRRVEIRLNRSDSIVDPGNNIVNLQ